MKKLSIGVLAGTIIGILICSYFVNDFTFDKLIYTKITLSAILTGLFSGVLANYTNKEFNLFLGCLIIGAVVFYLKYLITGHDFDPINMGSLTGALIGFVFFVNLKLTSKRNNYRM